MKTNAIYSIFVLLGCFGAGISAEELVPPQTTQTDSSSLFCSDINPQTTLDIQQLTGMWYASEVLSHNENAEGVYYYNSCVIIHLADITYKMTTTTESPRDYSSHARKLAPSILHHQQMQRQNRYLSLIWDENGKDVKYSLKYNQSKPGLWINYGEQKGSMLVDMQFEKFRGTIQVVKAVQNHLVLTFCNHEVNSTLFSVVLTRKPHGLSDEELRSIRGLLHRRGLATGFIRKVCHSGASTLTVYSALLVAIFLFTKQFAS